jgi:hypothetical protein
MDKFRKQLLNKSGIEDILENFNVQPKQSAASDNVTLFIGFEKSGKRELVQRINGNNFVDYNLIDEFSKDAVQKMSNAIMLSNVLEQTTFIKLVIVYKCSDLDNPHRSIRKLLKSMHYFLPKIESYKRGVGLLLTDGTCKSKVEEELQKNQAENKNHAEVLLLRIDFGDHAQSLIKDQLIFEKIIAGNFHLHTFRLIQETFVDFGKLVKESYSEMLNTLIGSFIPRLNFSQPLLQQFVDKPPKIEEFVAISHGFKINATHMNLNPQLYEDLNAHGISETLIHKEFTKFEKLQQKLKKVYDCLENTREDYVFYDLLDNNDQEIMMFDLRNSSAYNTDLLKKKYLKNFKLFQDVSYAIIEETVIILPDLEEAKVEFVNKILTSFADHFEQAVEKLEYDKMFGQLEKYFNEFSTNLSDFSISNEKVFKMVNDWREKSKNFTKMPIIRSYFDLFQPSSNDDWYQIMAFYEEFLCKIYNHIEVDPQMATFCRQKLAGMTLPWTSKDSFQTRAILMLENLKRNLTIVVTKTLMNENLIRVDRVVRKLNPVVTNAIIGRLFGEVRASEHEIHQHKRIFARQHYAIVDYDKFVQSLYLYTSIFNIKFPDPEWFELLAVQAQFDNVKDLSSESWIVPSMTRHNWGREFLEAGEILYYLTSGVTKTSSFINDAVKWTTMMVNDMQNVAVTENWVIHEKATNSMIDNFLMFLCFVLKKIVK